MNEVIKKENIENKIHEIRNVQVILDSDLANLYQCKNGTKDINKAVKRNAKRFPADFYFLELPSRPAAWRRKKYFAVPNWNRKVK